MIRRADTDADLESWVDVWNAITPREPLSAAIVRERWDRQPDRLYLVAEDKDRVVGIGLAGPSDTPRRGFVVVRVMPESRRRGIGSALYEQVEAHALSLAPSALSTHVAEDSEEGRRFAGRRGYVKVDRQVELVYTLRGDEAWPELPAVEIVELTEDLREAAYEITKEAWADFPLPEPVPAPAWDDWVREEFDGPIAFAAVEDGRLVGYAALMAQPVDGLLEHGLTACLRTHRGRGIGTALKRAQIAWAARNGYRELITFTQDGNDAMRAVNEKLGYEEQPAWLTMRHNVR
ncbi:MAG: N-acetyltransferase family protein [Gaiellaceae bacterium]